MTKRLDVSVVIPVYNEAGNVSILHSEIKKVLNRLKLSHEIIFVDDGSIDGTLNELDSIAEKDRSLRILRFRKNFGQSAALDAGFKAASGKIVVSMDGDLQDDPAEIPKFFEKIKQGYDVVCGWRYKRNDSIAKHIASRIGNVMRRVLLGKGVNDSGCTFRAYKAEAVKNLNLFGEMHRYLAYLLIWKGFKVCEIKINHRPRIHGRTKYGATKLLKGFLDMVLMKFWMQYSAKPVHLFGGFGMLLGAAGFLIGLWLTIDKIVFGTSLSTRPLLLLAVLLIILGLQSLSFGILADILIKSYYRDGNVPYSIAKSQ